MVKLSEQIQRVASSRPTRTERKQAVMQEKREQQVEAQAKLVERAREVQEEKFQDVKTISDYEEIYQEVDPELRQFFTAPTTLKEQKAGRIAETTSKVQERKGEIKQELIDLEQNYNKERYNYTGDARKDFLANYLKERDYLKGYESGLGEGQGKLNQGQEISYSDIESFASDKGDYQRSKREARIERKKAPSSPQLSAENLEALGLDISTRGLTPEGSALIKKAGITMKPIIKQKVGETTLQFQKRLNVELEIQAIEGLQEEIKKGEKEKVDIEAVKVDTSKLGFWQKSAYTFRQVTPKMFGINYQNLIGVGGYGYGSKEVKEATEKTISSATPKVISGIKKFNLLTGEIGFPISSPIGLNILPTKPIYTVKGGKEVIREDLKLKERQEKIYTADLEERGLTTTYKLKFEEEYKTEFLKKYGEPIITGDITQEQAEIDFTQSEEAKEVGRRYQEVIDIERGKKITWKSAKLYGLSMVDLGLKLIPETYGGLLEETAVISGAVYFGGKIPLSVLNVAYGGGVVWGTATALDPTISPEKRVGGIVLVGTSATLLGYQFYKYLKPPVIVRTKIPKLKISVKADTVYLKDGKLYQVTAKGKTKLIDYVVDPKVLGTQKIRVDTTVGMRSVVYSSKFKQLLGFKPIYQGIPTMQKGTVIAYESIRGTVVSTTPSAYQKSLALLEKSKTAWLTSGGETQLISLKGMNIKALLRYTAPTVKITTIESQILRVVGDKARGQAFVLTEQPVFDVDKILGIKTKGARTIREFYQIEKYLKGDYVISDISKTKMFVTPEGASYQKLTQAGKTTTQYRKISQVNVKDIEQSFAKLSVKTGGLEISKKVPYRYQDITEKYILQQTIPYKQKIVFGEGKTTILKSMGRRQPIVVDLDKSMGISYQKEGVRFITPAKITKTPLSKTFAEETAVEKIKDIIKAPKTKPFTFDYTDDVTAQVQKQIFKDSKYAGTGLYERTESVARGLSQTQINTQVNAMLKTGIDPIVNIKTQIKDLIKLDTITQPSLKLGMVSLGVLGTSQFFKEDLKTDLKLSVGIKTDLKTNQIIKQIIKQAQPQAQKSAQALKLSQVLKLIPTPTLSPIFAEPVISTPTFKLPPITPLIIPFWLPTAKQKVKKKLDEKKLMKQLLYLPDFTARALGLDPKVLTESQAMKEIRKVQTGFEVRRGIKLLKGIPE